MSFAGVTPEEEMEGVAAVVKKITDTYASKSLAS